jgi:hypothetical protein
MDPDAGEVRRILIGSEGIERPIHQRIDKTPALQRSAGVSLLRNLRFFRVICGFSAELSARRLWSPGRHFILIVHNQMLSAIPAA